MCHLLAWLPKDMLWSVVVLTVHFEPLLLAELAQQSVVPTQDMLVQSPPSLECSVHAMLRLQQMFITNHGLFHQTKSAELRKERCRPS